jgi:hypothetical protein
MHKKKVDRDPSLLLIYNKMKKQYLGELSLEEFNRWTAEHSSLVSPLKMLQVHLRGRILGDKFWENMSIERKENPELGKLEYWQQLQKKVIAQNNYFRARKLAEENELKRLKRRGKGKEGDCRDNLTKRQSILMGYFNLRKSLKVIRRRYEENFCSYFLNSYLTLLFSKIIGFLVLCQLWLRMMIFRMMKLMKTKNEKRTNVWMTTIVLLMIL